MPLEFNPNAGKREYFEGTISQINESGRAIEYIIDHPVYKYEGKEAKPAKVDRVRQLVYAPRETFTGRDARWVGHITSAFTLLGKRVEEVKDVVKELQPLVGKVVRFNSNFETWEKNGKAGEAEWFFLTFPTSTVSTMEQVVDMLEGKSVFEALKMQKNVGESMKGIFEDRVTLLEALKGKLELDTKNNKLVKIS